MVQRKQVCDSIRMRMKLPVCKPLTGVTSEQLLQALREFQTDKPNQLSPAMSGLVQSLRLGGMKVMGSPFQKMTYRHHMMGLTSYFGPPALFVTINPSDLNNPKVFLFIFFWGVYVY